MQPFGRPMSLGRYPVRARNAVAMYGAAKAAPWRAHRRLNDGENLELLRVNGHWTTAYALLQENLEGEAGMVRLTGEAVSTVEGDDVDRGNLHDLGETPRG
jgi:hypothetical protein